MSEFFEFDSDPWQATLPADAAALTEGLNPQQRAAVEYRGPALLILAGAGSGKTRVLTHRIAHLIALRDAWPSQILAITFTNKAAAEMRERVAGLLGQAAEGMWVSTFHSACVRILRREAENFGYRQGFTIYDTGDQRALLKRIIKDFEADTYGFTPASVSVRISKAKNDLLDADAYANTARMDDPKERLFVEVFREYARQLERANAFDFDDLIAQTVYLFRSFPQVAARYRRRFRHVLVDEYQDTNPAQYALVHELTRPVDPGDVPSDTRMRLNEHGGISGASLTVVGDSDQSIYAFRGADMRNISEFERDFPGAHTILLEQNYRSTQNILSAANAVIAQNSDRADKSLWSDNGDGERIVGFTGYSAHDEAQFVAEEISALRDDGVGYKDIAVFYRTNSQTRALEEIFIRETLPYRVLGGTKFYERAEVKDAVAYLTVLVNPDDELALRRILNTPKRGIGPASEAELQSHATREGISFREAMRKVASYGLRPKVTREIAALSSLLDDVAAKAAPIAGNKPELTVFGAYDALLKGSGLFESFASSADAQEQARAENLTELGKVTKEFAKANPEGSLVDFLTDVSLVAAADDIDDESGQISLMTLHTAKGLEYDYVFVTGVEEGLLPHQISAIEAGGVQEERRLFYVGITRARKRLWLTLAMSRTQFGDTSAVAPSRFLEDIPRELIDWRRPPEPPRFGGLLSGAQGGASGGWGRGGWNSADSARGNWPSGDRSGGFASQRESGSRPSFANSIDASSRAHGGISVTVGDTVEHDEFGRGKVRGVSGQGAKRKADIDFGGEIGRKRLIVNLAPLRRID